MLIVIIPHEITAQIEAALGKAGSLECGGILLGEHVGPNTFVVREITIQDTGSVSRFLRSAQAALRGLNAFFKRSGNRYEQFNYLGEWHSHPLFSTEPSSVDHASMQALATDEKIGANFIVLLVVKLDHGRRIVGSLHTYLPTGDVYRSTLKIERQQ